MTATDFKAHRFVAWSAMLATLVGAGAMLSWWLGFDSVLQAGTTQVPIQFNTALGLFLCGLALLGLVRGKRWIALVLLLPVFGLALPGLLQELSGIDLGIDEILYRHWLAAEGVAPGRMAPNTAFCLILSAMAVTALTIGQRLGGRLFASVVGVMVLLVVLVVLAGYAFEVPLARAWGERTPMALVTTFGLGPIALALLGLGWSAWKPLSTFSRAIAFAGGLAAAALTFAGWLALDAALMRGIEQRGRAEAEALAQDIEVRTARFLGAVPALARRMEVLGSALGPEDFLREAAVHSDLFDVSHVIAWVDPEGTALLLTSRDLSPESYRHVEGTSVLIDEARKQAFELALRSGRPVLSGITTLAATGERAMLIFAAVTLDGVPVGVVAGAIDIEKLFGELLLVSDPGFAVAIHDESGVLWRGPWAPRMAAVGPRTREFELFQRVLRIEVTPHLMLVRQVRGNLPEILLMIGLVAAGLISLSLALAGLARERMREALASSAALEASEHRAGRVLDSMTDGYYSVDRDWRFVRVNPQALELLRKSPEELLQHKVWDVFPEVIDSDLQAMYERVMDSGDPESTEIHYPPLEAWFEVRAFASEDGLSVYFRDVTLRHLERAMLERSENQLRQAQAVASVGSWELDVDQETVVVSGHFFVLHGVKTQTFDGAWPAFLAMLPEPAAACMVEAQTCAMAGDRAELQYRIDVDGETRIISLAAEAVMVEGVAGTLVLATAQDITGQETARARLAESEARHRGIVEASLDGIITIDAGGLVTEFNPAAETLFGWRREQVMGRDLADIIIPERLRQRHRDGMQRYIESGESRVLGRQLQVAALHADGSEFTVELGINRIGTSEPAVFTGFVRDISQRLRAEAALKRQAQIIDQIHDAVAEVDMDGMVRSWNKGSERMLGFSAEEMIGTPIERIYPPEFSDRRRELIMEPLLATGEHHVEVEQVRKNGSRIWVNMSLSLIRDEAGRPIGSLGYSVDITRRRLAEDELRLQQRAVESSANGIIVVDAIDPELPILFVNPAFEHITGFTADEVRGRNCRFLQGEDRDQPALATLRRAVAEERECHVLLRNYRKDGKLFWNELQIAPVYDDEGRTTHFVGVQNDVTERHEHELLLEHRAFHDENTGLPNRSRMLDLLAHEIAQVRTTGRALQVIMVNLDRLHQVNDALGYLVGDQVIIEAAARLTRVAQRAGGLLGRVGGDEFLLVVSARAQDDLDDSIAERAIGELSRPYEVPGQRVFLTASAGISVFSETSVDAMTLMAHADIAVKRAKQAGRNQCVTFSTGMAAELADRVSVGAALRGALVGDELDLHLQPLINAKTGAISAAEALMRWNSAELGFVSPARFIPVAEDSGLIVVLGDWALRSALEHASTWSNGSGTGRVPISVNVSAVQFQRPEFLREVEEALEQSGLPAAALKLEITESVVMEDAQQAIALLHRLRAIGVRVALDDFGTGHSSLGYLRHLPIDELKIDRVFVQDVVTDPYAAALCRAIISMSRELGMSVVAEGVETEAQARFLVESGVTLLQGYLFCKPQPSQDFAALLREGARWHLDGSRILEPS